MTEIKMPTKYQPQQVEANRYQWWLDKEVFKANRDSKKTPYTIVIPPPNVTGKLHLGHAWDTTLQDIITRMKRMQGFDTLYLPGMDHAGIATQAKVEAKLREEGISRYDLGRDKFLEKTWEWKEEYADFIRSQWAKLGLGLDYSRERFTLDEGLSDAVKKVFVDLYNKGIIYRGEKIINWDPSQRTALSNIEVIYKDVEGAFYHLKYPLSDGSGYLDIATTRPETMFGDTAVAVHPDDERYQQYIGKTVMLPIVNREIPIVADTYVEMDFGSGVVKITPAHDPNDFEVGNRHDLPRIVCMHEDGTMNEQADKYNGMDRFACRKQLIKDLQEAGICFEIEKHVHSVGHSERSGAVVEPYLSKQWFVDMSSLSKKTLDNQQTEGKVHFYPERFENTFNGWMTNVHDWVISRQLWWGHQIPAWYHNETGEVYVGEVAPEDSHNWTQDEDVLDTWFSSALWPFSTLNWPNEDDEDFKHYFPTNTLVTGYDIIFFWVARMVFQGLEFTNERPFKDVLLHGLVRDEQGRKMSKSLGNGVDPMDVIEEYGADALRYFLATGSTPGQDLRYMPEKVSATWNFINKIWNASRFALMNMDGLTYEQIDLSGKKSIADSWILTRLNETITDVTRLSEKYEFGEVGRILYNFIWDDVCDWYIEMSKLPLQGDDEEAKATTRSVLAYVFDNVMRLLHPFMPFVTEEIWQNLPHQGDTIVTAAWPMVKEEYNDQQACEAMNLLMATIRSVRNIRSEVNTPMSKAIPMLIKTANTATTTLLLDNKIYIDKFCNTSSLVVGEEINIPEQVMSAIITNAEIYLPLEGLIDTDKEIARLEQELSKLQQELDRVAKKLANEKFVASAPEVVVAKEREKQTDYQTKYDAVKERLEQMKANK